MPSADWKQPYKPEPPEKPAKRKGWFSMTREEQQDYAVKLGTAILVWVGFLTVLGWLLK